MKTKETKIIVITGGVGAGKSSVLDILERNFHIRVILTDQVAHDMMEPGTEGLRLVVEALGESFIREDHTVDRKALADIIFHDEEALKKMNAIIHPMVWDWIRYEAEISEDPYLIVETALFNTAPKGLLDEIWYVYTTEENRIQRLMESRGYTREKCISIIRQQESEEMFRKCCTRVIDNNGSAEETEKQLKEILEHEIC